MSRRAVSRARSFTSAAMRVCASRRAVTSRGEVEYSTATPTKRGSRPGSKPPASGGTTGGSTVCAPAGAPKPSASPKASTTKAPAPPDQRTRRDVLVRAIRGQSAPLGDLFTLASLGLCAGGRQSVEPAGVVGGDRALVARIHPTDVREQLVHGARELGVGMGVVGGPDDPLRAHVRRLSRESERLLVSVERDVALTSEVLRRRHADVGHVERERLVVMIETLHPRRDPSAIRLEDDEGELGE